MTEMIERVARAIDTATSIRAYGLYDYSRYKGSAPPHVVRNELTNKEVFRSNDPSSARMEYDRCCRNFIARAAIEAMREPTTEAIRDGAHELTGAIAGRCCHRTGGRGTGLCECQEAALSMYSAMIDAALRD